jgi:hypothetical protein
MALNFVPMVIVFGLALLLVGRSSDQQTQQTAMNMSICVLAIRSGFSNRRSGLQTNQLSTTLGLAQHVAAAPHGLDVILAVRSVGELLAQFADENVDNLQLRLVHAAVEVVEEHTSLVRVVPLRRASSSSTWCSFAVKYTRAPSISTVLVSRSTIRISGLDHRLSVAFRSPHDRVDAGHQVVLVERLGHIVVGAEAQPFDFVFELGEAEERFDLRHAQTAQNLEARHVG